MSLIKLKEKLDLSEISRGEGSGKWGGGGVITCEPLKREGREKLGNEKGRVT